MPRRDGTGPTGTGPIGKGMGFCNTKSGFTSNCRRGFGGRNNFKGKFNDKELLEKEKEFLEHKISLINEQLDSLPE